MLCLVNTKEHYFLKCKQIFSGYKIQSFKGILGLTNIYCDIFAMLQYTGARNKSKSYSVLEGS